MNPTIPMLASASSLGPKFALILPEIVLFVGAVPERHWVMGIWLGNDDNSPSSSSSRLAAALWGDIVRASTAAP